MEQSPFQAFVLHVWDHSAAILSELFQSISSVYLSFCHSMIESYHIIIINIFMQGK